MTYRVYWAPVGSDDWQEVTGVSSVDFTSEVENNRTFSTPLTNYSFTVPVKFTYTPKLYRLLTGQRMPFKAQMDYYAREWSRKLTGIFRKHPIAPRSTHGRR